MAWDDGPGTISSIQFGATSVDGGLIEDYAKSTVPDEFRTAAGTNAERGSVLVQFTGKCLDVSAINAVDALMVARTLSTIIVTYVGGQTQTITNCIIRIKPALHIVTDACRVRIAADGTANTSLTTNFTDLGLSLGAPTFTPGFTYEGTDGCGRPFSSGMNLRYDLLLPGEGSIFPYALLDTGSHRNVKNQVAIAMPDGNHIVVTDGYAYYHYADEDAVQPRAVALRVEATGATWGAILGLTDGTASPTDELWTAASPTYLADMFQGFEFELTGFGSAESDIITW